MAFDHFVWQTRDFESNYIFAKRDDDFRIFIF